MNEKLFHSMVCILEVDQYLWHLLNCIYNNYCISLDLLLFYSDAIMVM